MVIAFFLENNKDKISRFFQKTYLLTNININIAFRTIFFILNNVKIDLNNHKLKWRSYTTTKIFSTTRQIKLVRKKRFAAIVFNSNNEIFVVYRISLASLNTIYISYKQLI